MRDDPNPLFDYAERLSGPVPDYLERIERRTHLRTLAPQMMCGRLQGRLLSLLSLLLRPRRILEIGTFTGYATLCLAEGLTPDGRIDTIEGNPETAYLARRHFAMSPYASRIELHLGRARALFPEMTGPYDIIFLDGDKASYPDYLAPCVDRLNRGGLLIADNVLWDGKAGRRAHDREAAALHEYNRRVMDDERLAGVVLPLRDGLSVARKR